VQCYGGTLEVAAGDLEKVVKELMNEELKGKA
jgi:hypothetical protein